MLSGSPWVARVIPLAQTPVDAFKATNIEPLNWRPATGHQPHGTAEACRMYAKKAGMDPKGQNILAEGRIRAERKAGKLLKGMEKAKGAATKRGDIASPRLADIGVTKKQSSRWQQHVRHTPAFRNTVLQNRKGVVDYDGIWYSLRVPQTANQSTYACCQPLDGSL